MDRAQKDNAQKKYEISARDKRGLSIFAAILVILLALLAGIVIKVKSDLKLDCIFGGILQDQTYQNVRLFVNDYFIGTLSFENGVSNMTYKIPRNIINQKILRLRFLVDRPEQQPIFDAGKTIWLNLAKIQLREDK